MAIQGIQGIGSSSRARWAHASSKGVDGSGEAEDSGPSKNAQPNVVAMIEQLMQSILKQLAQQMNHSPSDSGGSSGGGGSPPVSSAGSSKAARNGPGAGGNQAPSATSGASGGAVPSAAAPGASKPADGSAGGGSSSSPLLNEINRVRKAAGLSELKESASLDSAAAQNDQANNATGQLAHHDGLIDGSMGEITAGNSGGETAESAVQQWLDSPEHRAIMMNPDYTTFGGSISGGYSTADFS